jgi:hypothetical protein
LYYRFDDLGPHTVSSGTPNQTSSSEIGKIFDYGFLSESHSLCLDKKDLISAQLEACEKLSKYASDECDKLAVDREIRELRIALDLMA